MKKYLFILTAVIITGSCTKNKPDENIVTDYDGNVYNTVKIGTQVWLKENLKTTHYRNGDPIPNVTNPKIWETLTTGASSDGNNPEYVSTYGRLYNWYAATDPRGIAPAGYHLPSEDEWDLLTSTLGYPAGGKLREAGTSHWLSPNVFADNSSGFTALPGGAIIGSAFTGINRYGYWWSSDETPSIGPDIAQGFFLYYLYEGTGRAHQRKSDGNSIRCVKD